MLLIRFCPNVGPSGTNTQRFLVNKTELIEHIAKQADLSKAAATRPGSHHWRSAHHPEKRRYGFPGGFWYFCRGQTCRAHGRNPRTGAAIKIKKAKVPKFRPGKG
jgi:DNA-binding protein HU-beta